MRFSIKESNGEKMFFHVPAEAHKATGIHLTTLKTILERGGNPTYHRKSDNKLFEIREETPIKLLEIEGKDFFSLEKIEKEFGLSPTKFLNQVRNKKFAKKIDWISDELFPEKNNREKEPDLREEIKKLREENEKLSSKIEILEKLFSRVEILEKENERLFSRVETLETWKEAKVSALDPDFFQPSQKFSIRLMTLSSVIDFIGTGLSSEIRFVGPRTQKHVIVKEKRKYLPDLVKQIIGEHIHPQMENETPEEREIREDLQLRSGNDISYEEYENVRNRLRELKLPLLTQITKEVMKVI